MSTAIRRVGVMGIGLMGSGIAQVATTKGFDLLVVDVTPEILARGMERIRASVRRLVGSYQKTSGNTGIAPEEEEKIIARVETSTDRHDLLHCDIVIEAVIEDEPVKTQIISSLAELGYQNLLASNTSSISITHLASNYSHPDRFMGMHFMNPVPDPAGRCR